MGRGVAENQLQPPLSFPPPQDAPEAHLGPGTGPMRLTRCQAALAAAIILNLLVFFSPYSKSLLCRDLPVSPPLDCETHEGSPEPVLVTAGFPRPPSTEPSTH